jgi:hypothetical protein
MTRLPTPLPAGVRPEEFVYANGETTTVYRAPFQADGPTVFADHPGGCLMAFMYAHFVFEWRRGSTTLDVSHGYIDGVNNFALFRNVPIAGPWQKDTLVAFGTNWARQRLAHFIRVGRGEPEI